MAAPTGQGGRSGCASVAAAARIMHYLTFIAGLIFAEVVAILFTPLLVFGDKDFFG